MIDTFVKTALDGLRSQIDALEGLLTQPDGPPKPSTGTTLKLVQWNSHHGGQRTDSRYDPDGFADWLKRFDPDIISLNEIETPQVANSFLSRLKNRLGSTWTLGYDGRGNALYVKGLMPVYSQIPLHPTTPCFLKYAALSNGRFVGSCHLDAEDSAKRLKETETASQPMLDIILGDFNFPPSSAEHTVMLQNYDDAWMLARGASGGETKNTRIDYCWLKKGLVYSALTVDVPDTRDATGAMPSDHRPVVVTLTLPV